ncbi:hypothetical protein G2W53_008742 [Senna tora]|uniref:SWIM-type domain-containing protein n=1 Tax=Senna tora TaxID=362788 RepID=A0A834WX24_9FABA|nr:hypothetical protein G2W53_008742 [Senna tora]
MAFAELKELIHRTLKLSKNQVVSEIIYRMPYGRNPINFISAEVSDDEGMASMLHCHMQCLEFLPIPVIEICANTSAAMQPFEATDYIPHIEFNRRGEQECGPSQAFEGDDINEDSLEMAQEMLNMPTAEPDEELLDDEEFDALIGNDIEDPPSGAEYDDEDFVDNSDCDADDIQPIRYFVPTEAQSLCNVPSNPYDDEWSASGGEVWNETSNLKKGLVFPDKKSLGEAVKKFSFKRHVNYNVTRSGGKSYEATCVKHDNGCPWRVRACLKANIGMWLITKYDGDHCCATPSVSQDRSKLDSDIIAGLIRGMVERSADVPMSQIIQRVKEEYQFIVSYRKVWLGKQKALAAPHLKPVIQVDGTFLYGKYHHTLLIAMGQDGNRNIVPLAFAIVEGETKEAWAWFLFRVREFVVGRQAGVCLISDRSTGCLTAVEDEAVGWQPPLGHHVYCIRHVASNFNTKFRSNPLKKLLKNAVAYACEIKLQNLQDMEFGVQEPYNRQTRQGGRLCRVLLRQSFCDCGEFQSLRFPCVHVLAVCSYLNHEHELYVDPIYKLHNILAAYSYPFHPVAGEEYWPEVPGQRLRPNPAALRPPGRPRSTRIHNEMDWKEPGEKPKCSLCRGEGHNKKKCPNKKPIRIFHAGFLEGRQILLHVQRIPGAGDVAYSATRFSKIMEPKSHPRAVSQRRMCRAPMIKNMRPVANRSIVVLLDLALVDSSELEEGSRHLHPQSPLPSVADHRALHEPQTPRDQEGPVEHQGHEQHWPHHR